MEIIKILTATIGLFVSLVFTYLVYFKNLGNTSYEYYKKNIFVFPKNKTYWILMLKILFPIGIFLFMLLIIRSILNI